MDSQVTNRDGNNEGWVSRSEVEHLSSETDALVGHVKVYVDGLEEHVAHDGEAHVTGLDAAVAPGEAGDGREGVIHEGSRDAEVAPVVGEAEVEVG